MAGKLIYIERDPAHNLALKHVLENNGNSNDTLVKQYIGNPAGAVYKDQAIRLYRQYDQFIKEHKTAEAAATVDAIAYYALNQDIYTKQSSNNTEINVKDFADYRNDKLAAAKKLAEQARLAARTPRVEAFENYFDNNFVGSESERTALEGKVQKALTDFNGRTTAETAVNIRNNLKQYPASIFDDNEPRKVALSILRNQKEIEKSKGSTAVVATADAAHSAAAPAASTASTTGSLTPERAYIAFVSYEKAFNEITGMGGTQPALAPIEEGQENFAKVRVLMNHYRAAFNSTDPQAVPQVYAELREGMRKSEASNGYTPQQYATAYDIFSRAVSHWNAGIANPPQQLAALTPNSFAAHVQSHSGAIIRGQAGVAPTVMAGGGGGNDHIVGGGGSSRIYEHIDAEVQLALQAQGFSTGGKNSRKYAAGQQDMDQLKGPATDKAIIAWKTKKGISPATADLDDAMIVALKQDGQTALADKGASTPAAATLASVIGDKDAAEVLKVSDASKSYAPYFFVTDDAVKEGAIAKLKEMGVTLTNAQIAGITVSNGVVSSNLITKIERALHLKEDGKLDDQFIAAVGTAKGKEVAMAVVSAPAATPSRNLAERDTGRNAG